MLLRVEIPIKIPEEAQVNASWGSVLHGAVMEILPPVVSTSLHTQGVKPWSQYLKRNHKNETVWIVSALSSEMAQSLQTSLLGQLPRKLLLRQKGFEIILCQPDLIEKTTYSELADKHFGTAEVSRKHQLNISTPTTFKQEGKHVLFPSSDLIMNSLMQRWDAFADGLTIGDPVVREHLGGHVQIRNYRLSSASYSLDGVWLKGFVGQLKLVSTGPEALCRVASLLLDFARFSGLGVKTALGMGGISLG